MNKIEQNKKKKELAILQAAEDIFLCQGYVLTSMDKIAKQALVTKQTVYRYYPSKIDLFKATLGYIGNHAEFNFSSHLQETDDQIALTKFAVGFIQAHLSEQHLAVYKLLVSESDKAPEITRSFSEQGPDDTQQQLEAFFEQRLHIKNAAELVTLWTSMLLAHRSAVLIGMDKPDEGQIAQHAASCINFLLAAVSTDGYRQQ